MTSAAKTTILPRFRASGHDHGKLIGPRGVSYQAVTPNTDRQMPKSAWFSRFEGSIPSTDPPPSCCLFTGLHPHVHLHLNPYPYQEWNMSELCVPTLPKLQLGPSLQFHNFYRFSSRARDTRD